MKAERLFEKFELLAEAPGATRGLRALVLDLAMQGRLLPQDPADEPSRTTLMRARTRPTKRDTETERALPEVEEPYPVPTSWCWLPLASAMEKITDGTHHSPPNGERGDFKYVTAKNIKNDRIRLEGITYVSREVHDEIYSRCDPRLGDVLYIKDGATTGIATINDLAEPFSMLSSVALLRPTAAVDNRFLLWAMRSPLFYSETRNSMKGAAITRVTLSVLGSSLIPLPPLTEQKRIVAKVDELMVLCDRLEAQQQERKTRHTALASASLTRFSAEATPANLEFLFHRAYDIEPRGLRQAVLALAIRGRLELQSTNDEPVDDLLCRIQRKRRSLVATKKASNASDVHPVEAEERPFEVPGAWRWLRFGAVSICRDGQRIPVSKDERAGRQGPYDYYGASGVIDKIDGYLFDEPLLLIGEDGANLLNRSTPIAFLADGKYWVNNHAHVLDSDSVDVLRYLALVFNAIDLTPFVTGTAQPKMNQAKMNSIPIPVPPVEEQRRIVAKVDQLLALIDELEARLIASRANGEKLLEAVVAELSQATRVA